MVAVLVSTVQELDLGPIRRRLVAKDGLSPEQADFAIAEYRLFLEQRLSQGRRVRLSPNKAADQAWHCHILHTEKYVDDCMKIFGYFLHHRPHDPAVHANGDCGGACDNDTAPRKLHKAHADCGCGNEATSLDSAICADCGTCSSDECDSCY